MSQMIIFCIIVLSIILLVLIMSRSQALRKFGVIEILMLAVICVLTFFTVRDTEASLYAQFMALHEQNLGVVMENLKELETLTLEDGLEESDEEEDYEDDYDYDDELEEDEDFEDEESDEEEYEDEDSDDEDSEDEDSDAEASEEDSYDELVATNSDEDSDDEDSDDDDSDDEDSDDEDSDDDDYDDEDSDLEAGSGVSTSADADYDDETYEDGDDIADESDVEAETESEDDEEFEDEDYEEEDEEADETQYYVDAILEESLNIATKEQSYDDQTLWYSEVFVLKRTAIDSYEILGHKGMTEDFWELHREAVISLLKDAVQSESIQNTHDGAYALIGMVDPDSIAPNYAAVAQVSLTRVNKEKDELLMIHFRRCLIAYLLASICFGLFLYYEDKMIKRILQVLRGVASGRVDWEEAQQQLDMPGMHTSEVHALTSSLGQIYADASRLNYQSYRTMQAYYRFAPKGIDRLLNKQSMVDVNMWDQNMAQGTLALVRFERKNQSQLAAAGYAQIEKMLQDGDGILLSRNGDFSALQIMFASQTEHAQDFAMQICEREQGEAFVLLHRVTLTVGAFGDESQAYTYATSEDMSLLEKYMTRLVELKLSVVVTEQVKERLTGDVRTRFIGVLGDDKKQFKLYEVLDACSGNERLQKEQYTQEFEQSIMLYYKGEYYQAKKQLLVLLRECPNDAMIKHYIGLCEQGMRGMIGAFRSLV